MTLKDSLITISPITDVIPLIGGPEVDLVCLSGYHLRSYLTFVKEYIPCDIIKLRDNPGIKGVFTFRDRTQGQTSIDLYIFISQHDSTMVLVPLKPG